MIFFIHRFAIFIVLVLSYCCFLLIFYDRVWNGTFTTFAIITLRCFNEYWARGCRDANRLSAYIGRYSASVSTLRSLGRLSSPTQTWFGVFSLSHTPVLFYFFTWCTPISSSSSTSLPLSDMPSLCVACGCGYLLLASLRARMHINTSVHYEPNTKTTATTKKREASEKRNVQTMMGVS